MVQINRPEQIAFFNALAVGDIERVRWIVANNSELLNSYDYRNFGATPLTSACFSNRPGMVEALIELGADPNRKSDWNMGPWSPLHCAIYRRDKQLTELLLSLNATMDVHTAAGLGNCGEVERLLDKVPSRAVERGGDGCHPLHFADTFQVAQILLERGGEIDGRCIDHHSTPVQFLCSIRFVEDCLPMFAAATIKRHRCIPPLGAIPSFSRGSSRQRSRHRHKVWKIAQQLARRLGDCLRCR